MKRAMDLAGTLVGLALAGLAIVVLAVLIKRESPGPVFSRQTHLGLNGRPFQIIKLRSMKLAITPIEERIKYDLFSVENWSMLLNCKIILMTLAPRKNAY